jgi:capsular polysaccharide transport system permease protein
VIGIPALLAVLYYGILASNQYVTTFEFAVRGPSQAALAHAGGRGGGGVTSAGAGAMSPDSFVVAEYINSGQAVADVERLVDLKAIFGKPDVDRFSALRLPASSEEINAYWRKMVFAQFDLITGNISVSVRAFSPGDSLRLAKRLVSVSDEMFRRLNINEQREFVRVADENLERAQARLAGARQALVDFRAKSGLVNAAKTAEAGSAIVDELRKQLAIVVAQTASLRKTSPRSPVLESLQAQAASLEQQIRNEDRLGGSTVNSVAPEILQKFEALDVERQFGEKQYADALELRTQAYLTAQNQQSFLALFVQPTLPQISLYPNRWKAILTVVLAAGAVWFVGMMMVYAVRDHLM